MRDLIGQTLGHFRVEAKLGEGGMGVVYRASDETLRREVALKVLPDSVARDDERRRRFLREARAAAAVTHPNIATVYEVGEAGGVAFIAMELVAGVTLREAMVSRWAVPECLRVVKDILRGLARAHDKGLVHRDLKPENVMLTPEGEVKILDFGLAKIQEREATPVSELGRAETASQLTDQGQLMGTPAYMSPEQARGEALDARSDVFSVGVMLYELLAGRRPFGGASTVAVMVAVLSTEPEPLERVSTEVTAQLADIVAACLAKRVEDRFGSARQVLTALEGGIGADAALAPTILAESSPAVRPDVSPERRSRPRVRLAAAVVVAVGVLTVAGLALVPDRRPRAGPEAAPASASVTPVSANAEAARIYEQANDDFAAGEVPTVGWRHALELDPDLCEARVKLAAFSFLFIDPGRPEAEFEKARPCMPRLGPEDRALAEVVAELIDPTAPADAKQAASRRASDARPTSAQLAFLAGWQQLDPASALSFAERALLDDPAFILAYDLKAGALSRMAGKANEARETLDACLMLRPGARACASRKYEYLSAGGHCGETESLARSMIARHPSAAWPYDWLGDALLGQAVDREAVEQAWQHAYDRTQPVRPADRRHRILNELQLGLVYADFPAVERALVDLEMLEAANTNLEFRWFVASARIESRLEEGQVSAARDLVRDFGRRVAGYSSDERSPYARLDLARRSFELDAGTRSSVVQTLDAALRTRPLSDTFSTWLVTLTDEPTPEQARVALREAPQPDVLQDHLVGNDAPTSSYAVGMTLLRAGQAEGARPWLERAVRACKWWTWGDDLNELRRVRAYLALGEACEATRDLSAARTAYREVLRRWSSARPRSVSADKARARLASIGG